MLLLRSKIFFLLLGFSLAFAGSSSASKVEIAVGWSKPPYVIEENNSGFEIELLKDVFALMEHEVQLIYVPLGRSHYMIKQGKIDVAMTLSPRLDIAPAVMSDSYISYQNVAISLKGRGINIKNVAELKNYSVVGFQNASLFLGDEYFKATKSSPFYIELPDQKKQVEMLLLGRADVVVMDVNIFNYLSMEKFGKSHMENVDVHKLFDATHYHLGFFDIALKNKFNQALVEYKNSKKFDILVDKYTFLEYND